MNTEILGIIAMFALSVALAIPFGKYIAKVYAGSKTLLDPVFNPIERFFYKASGIDPKKEMTWKQHLVALLTIKLCLVFTGNVNLNDPRQLTAKPR